MYHLLKVFMKWSSIGAAVKRFTLPGTHPSSYTRTTWRGGESSGSWERSAANAVLSYFVCFGNNILTPLMKNHKRKTFDDWSASATKARRTRVVGNGGLLAPHSFSLKYFPLQHLLLYFRSQQQSTPLINRQIRWP